MRNQLAIILKIREEILSTITCWVIGKWMVMILKTMLRILVEMIGMHSLKEGYHLMSPERSMIRYISTELMTIFMFQVLISQDWSRCQ